MRVTAVLMLVSLLLTVSVPATALAAGPKGKSEVVMKIGSKVHVFQGKKEKGVAVGDEIPVYRLLGGKDVQPNEVGKIRVTGFLSEHYFEAEIVSGEVKVGDIAKKEGSGYLIQKGR